MKKITIIATSIMLLAFANVNAAEKRIGISATTTIQSIQESFMKLITINHYQTICKK